jgi:hypothetical protein
MIDNSSLLLAIAFSGAALVLALVIGLIAMAVVVLGIRQGAYELQHQLLPFPVMLAGFGFIFSGSRLFVGKSPLPALPLAVVTILATTIPIVLGFSGVGTISLNVSAAVFMLLCGFEFWGDRHESRLAVIANAVLLHCRRRVLPGLRRGADQRAGLDTGRPPQQLGRGIQFHHVPGRPYRHRCHHTHTPSRQGRATASSGGQY